MRTGWLRSVQVEDGSVFPADLVLLSSAHPEGVCYIETMNLDGETNLKLKKVQCMTPLFSSVTGPAWHDTLTLS